MGLLWDCEGEIRLAAEVAELKQQIKKMEEELEDEKNTLSLVRRWRSEEQETLKKKHEAAVAELDAAHAAKIAKLTASHTTEMNSLREEMVNLQQDHNEKLERSERDHRTREQRNRDSAAKEKDVLKKKHEEEVEKLRKEMVVEKEKTLTEKLKMTETAKENVMKMSEMKEKEMDDLRKDYEARKEQIEKISEKMRNEKEEEIKNKITEMKIEADIREKELEMEKRSIEMMFKLEAKVIEKAIEEERKSTKKLHEERMQRKDEEIASIRKEASERETEIRNEHREKEEEYKKNYDELVEINIKQLHEIGEILVKAEENIRQQNEMHYSDKLDFQEASSRQYHKLHELFKLQSEIMNGMCVDVLHAKAIESDGNKLREATSKLENSTRGALNCLFDFECDSFSPDIKEKYSHELQVSVDELVVAAQTVLDESQISRAVKDDTRSKWKEVVDKIVALALPLKQYILHLLESSESETSCEKIEGALDEILQLIEDLPSLQYTTVSEVVMRAHSEILAMNIHHSNMLSAQLALTDGQTGPIIEEPNDEDSQ